MIAKIPVCYFDTTVAFVDDDISFLHGLKMGFKDKLNAVYIDNPLMVDEIFQKRNIKNPFFKYIVDIDDIYTIGSIELSSDRRSISICNPQGANIYGLHSELFSPGKDKIISVLVLDYSMPNLMGSELCEIMKKYPCKKIMLTGDASYNMAVDMFNSKLIDRFIDKGSKDFLKDLNQQIQELKHEYFAEQTEPLWSVLPISTKNIILSQEYNLLFQAAVRNYVKEYYLLDEYGSTVFVNKSGDLKWLIIQTEEYIENCYDIALDQGVSFDILRKLKRKEFMPFVFGPQERFSKCLEAAKKLQDHNIYYYSLVEGHKDALKNLS